jgi:hypothetical protein
VVAGEAQEPKARAREGQGLQAMEGEVSYRRGDLQLTVPKIHADCDERGHCWACDEEGLDEHPTIHGVIDARNDCETGEGAYLPHSCNEWMIGGPEEIAALISDLEAAKALLEEREKA